MIVRLKYRGRSFALGRDWLVVSFTLRLVPHFVCQASVVYSSNNLQELQGYTDVYGVLFTVNGDCITFQLTCAGYNPA